MFRGAVVGEIFDPGSYTAPPLDAGAATRGFIFVRNLQPLCTLICSALLISTIPSEGAVVNDLARLPSPPESYTCLYHGKTCAIYAFDQDQSSFLKKNSTWRPEQPLTRSKDNDSARPQVFKEVDLGAIWSIENGSRAGGLEYMYSTHPRNRASPWTRCELDGKPCQVGG